MRAFTIIFTLFSLIFLTSFDGGMSISRSDGVDMPVESFGFVISIVVVKHPELCEEQDCEMNVPTISSASGVVVSRQDGVTRLLTAGHACAIAKIGDVTTYVQEFNGNIHLVTTQIYSEKPDLCLLETPGEWGVPLKISDKTPKHGDSVWNMAAPGGIFDPGMILTFGGYYSGRKDESDWFSIPAAPGSSGSAILNSSGEIVGIIHSALLNFPSVAVCVTREQIKSFYVDSSRFLSNQNSDSLDELQ